MTKTLKVNGMNCMHCAGKVGAALEMVEGITSANASVEDASVTIEMEREVPGDEMAKAVSEMGYELVVE